jgi:DNA-binding transcriptional ArsR family regulator
MTKKKIKNMLKNPVKKDIMDFLLTENGAYFGDLVMNMDESQLVILEHLIELKKMGWIYKDDSGGRFRINEDYFLKMSTGEKRKRSNKPVQEWTIVDELNHFAESTRARELQVDNEISLNKRSPREQKIDKHNSKKKA